MSGGGEVSPGMIAIALQVVFISSIVLWLRKKNKTTPAEKLHVNYGSVPPPPLPLKIIASLPDWIRIPLLIKSSKPTPPRDSIVVLGRDVVDPYDKREIVPGKVWGVQYSYLIDPEFKKAMESILGSTKDVTMHKAITNAPDHMKQILQNDIKALDEYNALSEEGKAKMGGENKQDMLIAKINVGKDGEGLLIYNPSRMHPHMIEWINSLGEVKFIISGSSSHTNNLPGTAEAFPDAKIVCASAADAKCRKAGMRPADYLYDLHFDSVREALLDSGVALFHVSGDVATQALFVLVHRQLFEVDLLYTPSDETLKEIEFETGTTIYHCSHRLFYYGAVTEKEPPLGYKIPFYRCMFMDPTTLMGSKMVLNPPKRDGSSCAEMANSLRKILKVLREPGVCKRVHSVHSYSLSLDDFCKRMDETWGWLDGKSFME